MSWRGTMHLFGICIFEQQQKDAVSLRNQAGRRQVGKGLSAVAAVLLAWTVGISSGVAQQTPGAGEKAPEKAASELPSAPSVVLTEPVNLRPSLRDFSKPAGRFLGNPINMYRPTSIGTPNNIVFFILRFYPFRFLRDSALRKPGP